MNTTDSPRPRRHRKPDGDGQSSETRPTATPVIPDAPSHNGHDAKANLNLASIGVGMGESLDEGIPRRAPWDALLYWAQKESLELLVQKGRLTPDDEDYLVIALPLAIKYGETRLAQQAYWRLLIAIGAGGQGRQDIKDVAGGITSYNDVPQGDSGEAIP